MSQYRPKDVELTYNILVSKKSKIIIHYVINEVRKSKGFLTKFSKVQRSTAVRRGQGLEQLGLASHFTVNSNYYGNHITSGTI